MTKPRAHTPEEMRQLMFEQMAATLKYWAKIDKPFTKPGQTEVEARMEGFLFSLLVMFDGGTAGDVPALNIVPAPHPADEQFCRDNGQNWWAAEVINDTQMHEVFPWEICR